MKNEEKVRELGLEKNIRFYYDKHDPRGIFTICVIKQGDRYVRGLSICSPKDQFVKKVGRAIALGRAVQALVKDRDTIIPFNGEEIVVSSCGIEPSDYIERLFSYAKES